MKKYLLKITCIAAFAVMLFSCSDSSDSKTPSADTKSTTVQSSLKVAFVELDSITSQYKFCKDYTVILQKKEQNIQSTLNSKAQALQSAYANFQQKIQNNEYTRERAEQVQRALQKQEADLQALQQRLAADFDQESAKFLKAFQDSIQNYLKKYNSKKKYDLILTKATVLEGNDKFDITEEIVEGLNKAYKPATSSK